MKKRILILFLGLCATLLALPMAAYAAPVINQEPQSASYEVDEKANPLSVEAAGDEGEQIAYQWYSNTTDSTDGGTSIEGETDASYTPPTDKEGITWYYCIVTTDGQNGPESVTTSTARIEVASKLYDVWVGGAQITNLNADDVLGDADEGATVTYDAETNTLTLDNANIAVDDSRFAIYAEQDLTISLVGTNSVTLAGSAEISGLAWESALDGGYTIPEPAAPIACKDGSLTIQSDDSHGSLEATNGAGIVYRNDLGSLMSVGIVATGTVHIENAEVEATANFTYESNGAKKHSYGIFAGQGIVVDGANVMATSDEAIQSAGIYALTGDISLNGNVIANGDRAVNHDNPYAAFSAGIYASEGSVNIADGIVGATAAGLTEGGAAYGIFGYSGISITGGEVHAIGATSNMDGVDPLFGAGLFSSAGNIAISGKNTQVEADGGYASNEIAGIYANAGDIIVTDASVKASAWNLYGGDTAVGIYAGKLQVARSSSATGNIVLSGADVQVVGITAPVSFNGSLTVTPDEGMRYAVDALDKMIFEYPGLSWDEMAAAAKGIEGSPFAEKTSIDNEMVAGQEYLHFYNVAAEAEPETPEEPTDPVVPEEPSEPNEPTETPDEDADAVIPKTGDFGAIAPLAAAVCSTLAIGAGMAIRRKNR